RARRRSPAVNRAGVGSSAGGSAGHAVVGIVEGGMAGGLHAEDVAGPAHEALELDRRMFDLELVREDFADLGEDLLRLRYPLVVDQEMRAHRPRLRAKRPDVQVV